MNAINSNETRFSLLSCGLTLRNEYIMQCWCDGRFLLNLALMIVYVLLDHGL